MPTVDEILVLDLHGNSKKKEAAPDGGKDENVFDIQQGVAVFIGIKTGKKKPGVLAKVRQLDLYGKREAKYEWLDAADPLALPWRELTPQAPHYFFVPRDYSLQAEYDQGVSVAELFPENVTGIVTMGDAYAISMDRAEMQNRIQEVTERRISKEVFDAKYSLGKNYSKWVFDSLSANKIVNSTKRNSSRLPIARSIRATRILTTSSSGGRVGKSCTTS